MNEGAEMTAREKFNVDQRVRMSKEAIDQGLDGGRPRTGWVNGFPSRSSSQDHRKLVYVRRDGNKTAAIYHMDLWEAEQ